MTREGKRRRRYGESYSSKQYRRGNAPFGYKWRIKGPRSRVKHFTVDDLPEDSKLRSE